METFGSTRKTKVWWQGHGLFDLKQSSFVTPFDVCQASKPVSSIDYDKKKKLKCTHERNSVVPSPAKQVHL